MRFLKTSILTIVILTISSLFYSCSDDKTNPPITLKDGEGTAISLVYPSDSEIGYSFPIEGGDGKYSVKSNNNEIVTAEFISAIDLRLKAISLGEAIVTITDQSENQLILTINVDYQKENFVIKKHDIQVFGADLTENEKKTIAEKYLTQIPIKVGGGYTFIYSDAPNKKGKAIIYTDSYGNEGIETTLEFKEIENKIIPESTRWGYEITINDEKRTFVQGRYIPSTRATDPIPIALLEDITAKVQIEYPKAELVYTSQVIRMPK